MCFAVVMLAFLATLALGSAARLAQQFGVLAVLPLLPLVYIAFGLLLVAVTVALKCALLPGLNSGRPIAMWSPQFAKWWSVCPLVDTTNSLFMRHFRGTVMLNWYYNLLVSDEQAAC